MNLLLCQYTILNVLFFINFINTSAVSFECQCTCCITTIQTICDVVKLNSVTIITDNCQTNKCLDACRQQYPNCELNKGILNGTCLDSIQMRVLISPISNKILSTLTSTKITTTSGTRSTTRATTLTTTSTTRTTTSTTTSTTRTTTSTTTTSTTSRTTSTTTTITSP
ncbi:unnamed protein product, partial [Adineta steineri]